MKKIKILVLILLTLVLTGCGIERNKTKITGDEFKEYIEKTYTVSNMKSQIAYAKSAYQVNENGIFLFFIEGNKEKDIEGLYLDEVQNITTGLGTEFQDEINQGDNWVMVQALNDDSYFRITKVENTFLYGNADVKDRDKIDKIFKELGY